MCPKYLLSYIYFLLSMNSYRLAFGLIQVSNSVDFSDQCLKLDKTLLNILCASECTVSQIETKGPETFFSRYRYMVFHSIFSFLKPRLSSI
jgi:hypothetical protein